MNGCLLDLVTGDEGDVLLRCPRPRVLLLVGGPEDVDHATVCLAAQPDQLALIRGTAFGAGLELEGSRRIVGRMLHDLGPAGVNPQQVRCEILDAPRRT